MPEPLDLGLAPVDVRLHHLNISDWVTTGTRRQARDDLNKSSIPIDRCSREKLVVTAQYAGHTACKDCGGTNFRPGHAGVLNLHLLDLPFQHEPVEIVLQRKRFFCRDCKTRTTQTPPEIHREHKMTNRLVAQIEDDLITTPVDIVAAWVGSSPTVVHKIFGKLRADLERGYVQSAPARLGLDDKYVDGKRRAVLLDLTRRMGVIDVLKDDKPATVEAWLKALPNRDFVRIVAIDASFAFRSAVRAGLPDAIVVCDRWHVMQLLARRIASNAHRECVKAWHHIWDKDRGLTREQAEAEFDNWIASLNAEQREAFAPFLTTYARWKDEILNYWSTGGVTNAATERANRHLNRIVSTIGKGFDSVRVRAIFAQFRPNRDLIRCAGCDGFFRHRDLHVAACTRDCHLIYKCHECAGLQESNAESEEIWKITESWSPRRPIEPAQTDAEFEEANRRFKTWKVDTPDWRARALAACSASSEVHLLL